MSAIISGRVYWTEFKELCYTNKSKKKVCIKETTAKIVMLAIADSADDFGENSWNSFETLATKTSIQRRSVIRVARALMSNNYLKIAGISRYGTNNFSINLGLLGQPPLRRAKNGRPKTSDSGAFTGDSDAETGDSEAKTGDPQSPDPSFILPDPPLNGGGLSEKELKQANAKVDAIIESTKKARYQNREKLPEPYLLFADLYNELTKQEPTKRVLLDWMQTFEEWKQEGLQPEHIRAAWNHANRPEGGFTVGRPGALTNTAVGMKSKMIAAPAPPAVDREAVEQTKKLVEEKFTGNFVPRPANIARPRGI